MTAADLKPSQLALLRELLAGKRQSDIARERGITVQSINVSLRRIQERAGVRTAFQLAAWAERHGIREGQS